MPAAIRRAMSDEEVKDLGPRAGSSSSGNKTRMVRGCPGTLSTSPRLSSVSTIWCTVGGVTMKYPERSASFGGYPWTLLGVK